MNLLGVLVSRAARALRGDRGIRVQRVLAGLGAVAVLVLPQVAMPQHWLSVTGLDHHGLWRVPVNALVALIFVPVLRMVSYRRRDWLVLAFVPVLQYVVAFRVGYRAALLPLRDWPARADERLRVRRVTRGGLWVLMPPSAELRAARSAARRGEVVGANGRR